MQKIKKNKEWSRGRFYESLRNAKIIKLLSLKIASLIFHSAKVNAKNIFDF